MTIEEIEAQISLGERNLSFSRQRLSKYEEAQNESKIDIAERLIRLTEIRLRVLREELRVATSLTRELGDDEEVVLKGGIYLLATKSSGYTARSDFQTLDSQFLLQWERGSWHAWERDTDSMVHRFCGSFNETVAFIASTYQREAVSA